MNNFDLIYYFMDATLLSMLVIWMKNSMEVQIETKVNMKWTVASLFVAVAVVCAFCYEGRFRIVQTGVMLLCAVLYYLQKSGLSAKGIVNMGSLTTWEKAGAVNVSRRESRISFTYGKRKAILNFDPGQMDAVEKFVKKHR